MIIENNIRQVFGSMYVGILEVCIKQILVMGSGAVDNQTIFDGKFIKK